MAVDINVAALVVTRQRSGNINRFNAKNLRVGDDING
jgi:hypothetical protein